jgi:hypothetical protein
MEIKKQCFAIVLWLWCTQAMGYNYGEHRYIGDMAMQRWLKSQSSNAYIQQYFPFTRNQNGSYFFPSLSGYNVITYGAINGLAGDHSADVYELEELLSENGYLQKVVELHNTYIEEGFASAPDNLLLKIDKKYISLALKNMAHFYEYGNGWQKHFRNFDTTAVVSAIDRSTSQDTFKQLNKSNPLLMYATLHCSAIYLARQAGILASQNKNDQAKEFLYYAYLFNAFADHFLGDTFSSGHLLVNRSISRSLINNKSLHDFYNLKGTAVVNSQGEVWKAFGCNMYSKNGNSDLKSNLNSLPYENLSADDKRVIEAVQYSIAEIKEAFDEGMAANQMSLPMIPKDDFGSYAMEHYKALQLAPLPFGSNLTETLQVPVDEIHIKANSEPYLRNFIRNRSANSFVIGITDGIVSRNQNYFQGIEYRLNVGQLYSKFNLNPYNSKKGMSDVWIGYTVSYTRGTLGPVELRNNVDFYKVGLRSNLDLWVGDRSFVGLFMYTEVGLMSHSQKTTPVFSPQLGIQLGSLLRINYYNIPTVWRLPLQLILPLKFKINATYANGYRPIYARGVELDIMF